MEARRDHNYVLEKNNVIMKDISEKAAAYFVSTKRHHDMLQKICKNAVTGLGSENLYADFRNHRDVLAGRLAELEKEEKGKDDKGEGDAGKKEEAKAAKDGLDGYFATMREKQTFQASSIALQRQLEANKDRRDKMLSGFSQFCSFQAMDLIADGTVETIKVGNKPVASIQSQCKYLFYQMDEDLEAETEGGYRVELAFEE